MSTRKGNSRTEKKGVQNSSVMVAILKSHHSSYQDHKQSQLHPYRYIGRYVELGDNLTKKRFLFFLKNLPFLFSLNTTRRINPISIRLNNI